MSLRKLSDGRALRPLLAMGLLAFSGAGIDTWGKKSSDESGRDAGSGADVLGWWSMEGIVTNHLPDGSGHGRHGALTNFPAGSVRPGWEGDALRLAPGARARFSGDPVGLGAGGFGVSLWIAGTNFGAGGTLFGWESTNGAGWDLGIDGGAMAWLRWRDGAEERVLRGGDRALRLDDGRWHSIVAAADASTATATLYVDTWPEAYGPFTNWSGGEGALRMGPLSGAEGVALDLDDVRLHAVPLRFGEACRLYPIALARGTLLDARVGDVLHDILNGTRPGNFGWLTWSGSPSVPTLASSLTPPGDCEDYVNPDDPSDAAISPGDWIQGCPGVKNGKKVRDALDALIGQEILVPIWDQTRGQGNHADYRMCGAARVRLLDYALPKENRITVEFLGFASCGELNLPPAVRILEPSDGATFEAPADIALRAEAADPDGVVLRVEYRATSGDSNWLLGVAGPEDFALLWPDVGPGAYTLDAIAFDDGGLSSNAPPVAITVRPRTRATILSPEPDAIFHAPAAIDIEAEVEGQGIARAEFYANGQKIGEVADAPYQFRWTEVAPGVYRLTVVAVGADGTTTESEAVWIVVNDLPQIAFLSPTNGEIFEAGIGIPLLAEATDADGTIAGVAFFASDGSNFLSLGETFAAPHAIVWTNAAPGYYALMALATDDRGGTNLADPVAITVADPWESLVEETNFLVAAEAEVVIPTNPSVLSVVFTNLAFDTADPAAINDAIEFSLVGTNGAPLVPTFAPGRDACLNLTEGESPAIAPGVLLETTNGAGTAHIDISALSPGTVARLVARLVNDDADTTTAARIGPVSLLTTNLVIPTNAAPPTITFGALHPGTLDGLADISADLAPAFRRTSFHEPSGTLFADLAIENTGGAPIAGKLVVVIDGISDPSVHVLAPDGLTPDGNPAFDFSGLLPEEGLDPGAATAARPIAFHNPNRVRFTYRLTLLGAANRPPAFTSSPRTATAPGTEYQYDAMAEDPDGDPITFTLLASPSGMTISSSLGDPRSALVSWTPGPADLGNHHVSLRAEDGRGAAATQTFTLSVRDDIPNRPPAFTSTPVADANVGADYAYGPRADDPDGDPVTFTLLSGPEGMTLQSPIGNLPSSITWTPSSSQRGVQTVEIRADDGRGGTATQAFRVAVDQSPGNGAPAFVTEPGTRFAIAAPRAATGEVVPPFLAFDLPPGTDTVQTVALTLSGDAAPGGSADVIFVVDETGSMFTEHAWLADMIPALDARLEARGIVSNRFAMTAFTVNPRHVNTSGLHGYVALYSPNNRKIGAANVLWDGVSGYGMDALPADGAYTVVVTPRADADLPQSFRLPASLGPEPEAVAPEGFEQTYSGTLAPGQAITNTFRAPAGLPVFYDARIAPTSARATLVGPGNLVVIGGHAAYGDYYKMVRLPASGTYHLILADVGSGGPYSYRLHDLSAAPPIAVGETVSTHLPAGETASYRVEGAAGGRLLFYVDSIAPYTYGEAWQLFGADEFSVGNGLASPFTAALPDGGTYYLVLRNTTASTAYDHAFRLLEATTRTEPIAIGEPVAGTVAQPGQSALHPFEGTAGQRIWFDGRSVLSYGSVKIASLVTPSGAISPALNGYSLGANSGPIVLPETGTYAIHVDDRRDTGDYAFCLLDQAAAEPVSTGTDIEVTVGGPYHKRLFRIEGQAGQRLNFDGLASASGEWSLYGPGGNRLGVNSLDWDFAAILPSDGTYALSIDNGAANPITFRFRIDVTEPAPATPSGFGTVYSGTVTTANEEHRYTLEAPAGLRVFFDGIASDSYHFQARLLAPDGSVAIAWTGTNQDSPPTTLPQSGAYTLVVTSAQPGNYALRLLNLTDAPPLVPGAQTTGTLDPGLGAAAYRIQATPGQRVFIDKLPGTSTVGHWTLYGPDNKQIDSEYGTVSLDATLPCAEPCVLVIAGNTAAPISYDFRATFPEDAFIPAQTDRAIAGSLASPGDRHVYLFSAASGDRIYLDGRAAASPSIKGWLMRPTGGSISGTGAPLNLDPDPVTLTESGTYALLVYGGDATGDYAFRLHTRAASPPVGDALVGDLFGHAEALVYRFEAKAGQALRLEPFFGDAATAAWASQHCLDLYSAFGQEDGYCALDLAINGLDFRPDAAKNFILVSDNDHFFGYRPHLTTNVMIEGLRALDAPLNTVVNAEFADALGNRALGVDGDGNAYLPDGLGGFTTTTNGVFIGPIFEGHTSDDVKRTYVDLAWASGGGSWDLTQISLGGPLAAQSLTRAFVETKTKEILRQLAVVDVRCSDATVGFENLTGPLYGMTGGQLATFDVRLTAPEDARSFELLFVHPNTGRLLGSIPVSMSQRYRYGARAVDPDGDTLTYTLLESPDGASIDPATGDIAWVPTAPGAYAFSIRVEDGQGAAATQHFAVEVTAGTANQDPAITSQPPTLADVGRNYGYQLRAEDPDGHPLTWFLIEGPNGMALHSSFGDRRSAFLSWLPTAAQVGAHQVKIIALDGHGGEATQSFTLEVAVEALNHDPIFESTPNTTATPRTQYRYDIAVSDPDHDAIAVTLALAPEGMLLSSPSSIGDLPSSIIWTPGPDDVGSHTIILRATDARGAVTLQPFQVTVGAPNHPPVILSVAPPQAVADLPYEYCLRAQDPDGDAISFRLDSPPPGDFDFDATTGLLRFRPTTGEIGAHAIEITALDACGGETTQAYTLAVVADAPNDPPLITSTPPTRVRFGNTWSYDLQYHDPNGDPLTFQLLQAPDGMSIPSSIGNLPSSITWTPTGGQIGSHTIALAVSDGRGAPAEQTFTIQVFSGGPNADPEITSTPPAAATVNTQYTYPIQATDPDGDPLSYQLVDAPPGMIVSSSLGALGSPLGAPAGSALISWTPTASDLGPHEITLQVLDNLGGLAVQSFTLTVRGANLPPVIQSTPPTIAALDREYTYHIQAQDPEGEPITFQLLTAPSGMSLTSSLAPLASSLVWTPTTADLGVHTIELLAQDPRGGITAQRFEIFVSPTAPNEMPTLGGDPPLGVNPGDLYAWTATASDPEEGDITFRLQDAPEGMTIDPVTGELRWQTAPTIEGDHRVTLVATDPDGGAALLSFTIRVAPNDPPFFTSTPLTTAIAGTPYQCPLRAHDPDGDFLSFTLLDAPEGMMVDSSLGDPRSALLSWTPSPSQIGESHPVTVQVSDSRGGIDTQSFTLAVAADTDVPRVLLSASADLIKKGETVAFFIHASDNAGIESLGLTLDGTPVPILFNGAKITFDDPGLFDVVASATDAAGLTGTASVQIRVLDPEDAEGPFVELPTSQFPTNGVIDVATAVRGTVRDDALEFWRLEIAPLDLVSLDNVAAHDPDYRLLASGNANIENAPVGTLDPTTLANDSYVLRLLARDVNGHTEAAAVILSVAGELKPGRFTFAITDLNIPLAGVPIQITRVYDTLDAARSEDFGHGWRLQFRQGRVRESVPKSSLEAQGVPAIFAANPFKTGARVTLTHPDGRRVGFTFLPTLQDTDYGAGAGLFGTTWKPRFVPDRGVHDSLEVDDATLAIGPDGSVYHYLFQLPFNPDTYRLTTRDGRTYRYSESEGLLDVTDRNGNALTFSENGITHSSGASISFSRDAQGRITAITTPDGKAIRYEYDASGDLVRVTDPAGLNVHYRYHADPAHYFAGLYNDAGEALSLPTFDDRGRLDTFTDALGNPTAYLYSDDGLSETRIDAHGGTFTTTFDPRGNVTRTVNEIGAVSTTVYDANDNPVESVTPCACKTQRVYDGRGNVLLEVDGMSQTNRFVYDANGDLTDEIDPLGHTTRYGYDAERNLTSITDALGSRIAFGHDPLGRISTVTDARGQAVAFGYATADPNAPPLSKPTQVLYPDGATLRFEYNALGQATAFTDESGARHELVADDGGKLLARRDPLGNETRYAYDSEGRLTAVTNALGQATRFEYDAASRLVARIDPDGGTNRFAYDALGRLTNIVDQIGRATARAYRADGAMTSIRQADGTTIGFEYDTTRRRTAVIDPAGNRTEFRYDSNGRVTSEIDPLGKRTEYFYDPTGDLVRVVDRLYRTRRFDYDPLGRITRETWIQTNAVVKTLDMAYDSRGNLTSAADESTALAFAYDDRNRPITASTRIGADPPFILNYAYDGAHRRTAVTDQAGVYVEALTDPRGLVQRLVWGGGGLAPARVDMTHNAAGDMTGMARYADADGLVPAGTTGITFGRGRKDIGFGAAAYNAGGDESLLDSFKTTDALGPLAVEPDSEELLFSGAEPLRRITRVSHTGPSGNLLADFHYDYDPAGQLLSESNLTENIDYVHDPTGQLIEANRTQWPSETYTYDPAGNRTLSVTSVSSLFTNAYTTGSGNRVLSDSEYTYTHDDEGNLVSKTVTATGEKWAYTYDHRNRLTAVVQSDAAGQETLTVTFTYDPFDRRVRKTVSAASAPLRETLFLYDGENLWSESTTENGTRKTEHHLSGPALDQWLASQSPGQGLGWHLPDRLGSIRAIAASDGAVLSQQDYASYGAIHPIQGTPSRLAFTGREWDQETGLYYYRARYYEPGLGRFMGQDPLRFLASDFHLSRYAQNSPSGFVDPSGMQTAFEKSEIEKRVSAAQSAIVKCLGDEVKTNLAKGGLYLLIIIAESAADGGGFVYVGQTRRAFDIRLLEHAKGGKAVISRINLPFNGKVVNNPRAIRYLEQMMMNVFGGTAELVNVNNATTVKADVLCEAAKTAVGGL